ncbi:hypothetical protein RchiOBHm_Chr1g0332321 [Rosa chinensis]|uniref:Uncharacterized protein n=1 Tax=Rosa chinensis TaxID=74649 RepID=A0A2P6SBS9_ROSCH|nr:hypothetical protein RchiOBHm_Chr1g0332321 [Rosa chinensis]
MEEDLKVFETVNSTVNSNSRILGFLFDFSGYFCLFLVAAAGLEIVVWVMKLILE